MRKWLPWFKVYISLLEHPVFNSMSIFDRGMLLTLWLLAYNNKDKRGQLPDLSYVAIRLGQHWVNKGKAHVKDTIIKTMSEWFDHDPVSDTFTVHGLETWQSKRSSLPSGLPSGLPSRLPSSLGKPQLKTKDLKDLALPLEFKNTDLGSLQSPNVDKIHPKNTHKRNKAIDPKVSDYLRQVRQFITERFLAARGLPVSSCTTAGDWVQVDRTCKRCYVNGITATVLGDSFQKWLTTSNAWEARQRIAWWASNWQLFVIKSPISSNTQSSTISAASVPEDMDDCGYPGDGQPVPDEPDDPASYAYPGGELPTSVH